MTALFELGKYLVTKANREEKNTNEEVARHQQKLVELLGIEDLIADKENPFENEKLFKIVINKIRESDDETSEKILEYFVEMLAFLAQYQKVTEILGEINSMLSESPQFLMR